jgi:hypothetical protein
MAGQSRDELIRRPTRENSASGVSLLHGAEPANGAVGSASSSELPITKVASTLGGGASLGLAAAVLVPSAPVVAVVAAALGLIGSGWLVRRYG